MRIFGFAQCSISSGVNEMTRSQETDAQSYDAEPNAMEAAFANPEAAQAVTLFSILRGAARTGFGVKHGFAGIDSVAGFRATVPAGGLHTHRSMIELQRASGAEILTMDDVIAYVPSSSAGPRRQDCPVTVRNMFDRQQLMAEAMSVFADRGCRRVLDLSVLNTETYGVAFGGTEQWVEGYQWLSTVEDPETRAYLLCLIICSLDGIDGLVAGGMPAFRRLAGILERHGDRIVSDLEAQTVRVHDRVDASISRRVRRMISASQDTLDRLTAIISSGARLAIGDIFPEARLVGVDLSTGDSAWLSEILPAGTDIADLGCSMPEGLLSVASGEGPGSVPALLNVYFEFSTEGSDDLVGLDRLVSGSDYRVHVTTASGLYRCRLGLIARVVEWEGACPRLTFVRQPALAATNAIVEPGAALSAVQETLSELGAPRPFVRLTGRSDGGFRITLSRCSVEALGITPVQAAVDSRLCRLSLHYDIQREQGRIAPVEVVASPVLRPAVAAPLADADCSAA